MAIPTVYRELIERGEDPLAELRHFDQFRSVFEEQLDLINRPYHLAAKVSVSRLREAHDSWLDDLQRISKASRVPDHFKQAGHLAFWIRRTRPIIDVDVTLAKWPRTADLSPEDAFADEYRILMKYTNEYCAFEMGYNIVLLYQENRIKKSARLQPAQFPSWDFIECVTNMLGTKEVSPHSMFLIYKALFDGK